MRLSDRTNSALRRDFRACCVPPGADGPDTLKTIALVGGTLAWPKTLSPMDRFYLSACFNDLRRSNVPVSPAFEASIVNLDPKYGGEDFLAGGCKADIVVVCYVFNPAASWTRDPRDKSHYFRVSPRHAEPDIWYKSVLETGAKAVWTIGDDRENCEVGKGHFSKPGGELAVVREGTKNGYGTTLLLHKNYVSSLSSSTR